MYYAKVHAKAKTLPDEIQLCDESGVPMDDGLIELDEASKLILAQLQISWKMGLEKVILRVLKKAVKDHEKKA